MVTVKVPATTANLGPGFDTLGMALSLFLEVEMGFSQDQTRLVFNGEGKEIIEKSKKNLVLEGAKRIFKEAGVIDPCLEIKINNSVPVGKGLGSSATALLGGMYAANSLLNKRFSREEIINWAVEIEGHPDNIVPAVVGGLTTAMVNNKKVLFQKIELLYDIDIIVAVPDFILPTTESRSVLPENIKISDFINSMQKTSYLLTSLAKQDFDNIQLAMQDIIFQEVRKKFIPGFDRVVKAATDAGAFGVALSGAGPSIIALSLDRGKNIGKSMHEAFACSGVESRILHLHPWQKGIIIED